MDWQIVPYKVKPGLGSKIVSPSLARTPKISSSAPEHPEATITSYHHHHKVISLALEMVKRITLGVSGASGLLYRLAMASLALSSPLAGGYPLDRQLNRTSFTASVTFSWVSKLPNTDGSPNRSHDKIRMKSSGDYRVLGRLGSFGGWVGLEVDLQPFLSD